MANESNLIPFNQRTKSEQREFARQGGIASGKTRKRRKAIKETLNTILSLEVKEDDIKETMNAMGIDEEDQNYQMLLMMTVFKRAVKGDSEALNYITDMLQESSKEKEKQSDLSGGGTIIVDDLEFVDDEDNIEDIEEEPE